MTAVIIKAGHAAVIGECRRLMVSEGYPSGSKEPRMICLFVTAFDIQAICDLQEVIGDVCEDRAADVRGVPAVDDRLAGRADPGSRQAMIEQVRRWLDAPGNPGKLPVEPMRTLLSEYDLQRAKTDLANQEIERLKFQLQEALAGTRP